MSRSISYQRISCADFGNTKRVNKFIRRKPKVKDIKCGLKECKFNKGYCCCAKSIDVSTNTDCLTYSPDEKKRNSMFEAAADFIPANYSVDTSVACNAKCIFNKDNRCVSNGITVMNQGAHEVVCLTYVKD